MEAIYSKVIKQDVAQIFVDVRETTGGSMLMLTVVAKKDGRRRRVSASLETGTAEALADTLAEAVRLAKKLPKDFDCPVCSKKIEHVIVHARCHQEATLDGNKTLEYSNLEIDSAAASDDGRIECPACGADITKYIEQQ